MRSFLLRAASVLPLVVLAGVAVAGAVQTGCSPSVETGPGAADAQAPTCPANETLTQIGTSSFCCPASTPAGASTGASTSPGATICYEPDKPRAGDECLVAGDKTEGAASVAVSFDTCVIEACSGDRTATSYPQTAHATTPKLSCEQGDAGLVWVQAGVASEQTVVRECVVLGQTQCTGSGYGSGGAPYGYGFAVANRQVRVSSSTCTPAGGSPAPCPEGSL